jgi:gliding motility-associated-like protein
MQNAGLYVVEIMAGSCIARTDSTIVESMTIPDFSLSHEGGPNFCSGTTKSLSVMPALSSGFTYQWYEKVSGPIAEATFNSYIANASGEYYAVVTPNNSGCLPKQTGTLTVAVLQTPVAGFLAAASGCTGEEVAFTQQSTGSAGVNLVYLWTFGDGKTSDAENPANVYSQAESFEVSLKVGYQGLESCNSMTSKMIQISEVVRPDIIASASVMCEGESTELSVANTFSHVTWNTYETEASITITSAGNYSVATVDLHGCESADEITIKQKEVPQLTVASESQMIAVGQTVQLQATGADEYVWSPGKTLSDSTIANPHASPTTTTSYAVTGSIVDGCSSVATIVIQVSGEIVNITVPVLFSPNGDATNETLVIEGAENYPDCSLTVFDKRGGRVFNSAGYQNNWDGSVNGTAVPEGVYYYVFGCPNAKAVTGTVTIIR